MFRERIRRELTDRQQNYSKRFSSSHNYHIVQHLNLSINIIRRRESDIRQTRSIGAIFRRVHNTSECLEGETGELVLQVKIFPNDILFLFFSQFYFSSQVALIGKSNTQFLPRLLICNRT